MNTVTNIHPDNVLETLLAKGGRSQRTSHLKKLHDICGRQYEGRRDFSLPAIGRACEAEGILKARVLYNASSSDYRTLIEAWAAYAGPVPKRPAERRVLASHDYLMRIEDPAIRSIARAVFAERDELKAQLNILKSRGAGRIDRHPQGEILAPQSSTHQIQTVVQPFRLTVTEREALTQAISLNFLETQGWREVAYGEICEGERTIYDPGYTVAIRRVLGV